jgi:hypothetical protein
MPEASAAGVETSLNESGPRMAKQPPGVPMELRLGTCGWSYPDWKGSFYPPGTKDELAFYATQFDAVDIDSTFYHMPSGRTVDSWHRRTPDNFAPAPI